MALFFPGTVFLTPMICMKSTILSARPEPYLHILESCISQIESHLLCTVHLFSVFKKSNQSVWDWVHSLKLWDGIHHQRTRQLHYHPSIWERPDRPLLALLPHCAINASGLYLESGAGVSFFRLSSIQKSSANYAVAPNWIVSVTEMLQSNSSAF